MNRRELRKCPFCGGGAEIIACDDEGNLRSNEYVENPYSGLGYLIVHDERHEKGFCPIAKHLGETQGMYIYDSEEEAIEAWNRRAE